MQKITSSHIILFLRGDANSGVFYSFEIDCVLQYLDHLVFDVGVRFVTLEKRISWQLLDAGRFDTL